MGRSNTSTDALVELLSLCEQTLTALQPDSDRDTSVAQSDKANHSRYGKRASIGPRLVLISGGLSMINRGATAR
jgi:hypothetical protein